MEKPLGTIEQPTSTPIINIVQENENVRTFYFDIDYQSKPGQFVIMWLPRIDEKPFSIAHDENGKLGLSIANVGRFTNHLFSLKKGDLVGIRGPYGSWYTLEKKFKRVLMVGGGYGVAPLARLAKQAVIQGVAVNFCNGARTKNLLLYAKQLSKLDLTLHLTTNDGSEGTKGFVTETVKMCLNTNKYDMVYLCGPELMEKAILELCTKKNIPSQISIERYMKCGFGICGQCCVDDSGERMCVEGPVVSGKYALQQSEFGQYHRNGSGKREYYHEN